MEENLDQEKNRQKKQLENRKKRAFLKLHEKSDSPENIKLAENKLNEEYKIQEENIDKQIEEKNKNIIIDEINRLQNEKITLINKMQEETLNRALKAELDKKIADDKLNNLKLQHDLKLKDMINQIKTIKQEDRSAFINNFVNNLVEERELISKVIYISYIIYIS